MNQEMEAYDVANREVRVSKRFRRRPNHRIIARRNQAIFLLSMALMASVTLNVGLLAMR